MFHHQGRKLKWFVLYRLLLEGAERAAAGGELRCDYVAMNRTILRKVSKVVRATFTDSLSGGPHNQRRTRALITSTHVTQRMLGDKFAPRDTVWCVYILHNTVFTAVYIKKNSIPSSCLRVETRLRRDVRTPTEFRRVRRSHQHSLEPEWSVVDRAHTPSRHRRTSQA